ncbi:NAD-dependent epimerase/dehydratase family protein [Jeotgalibacillus salarius]|uniref:NAD-dependent epimerase/dehydratase family protein n=1 Tax=Jeotgalibacillus salarius TaxID=546023 RepID=UPI001FC87844|nr:NAD-dependent epimerase/dehydratase family protein [Jeotgalibacillus salarius]
MKSLVIKEDALNLLWQIWSVSKEGGQVSVLVTGASGNVGQYVVEALLGNGEHVIAASTDVEKLKRIFGHSADVVHLDFTNETVLMQLLEAWTVYS